MTATTEATVDSTVASSVVGGFAHRPALDGVRTIAVLLVIAFHADMQSLSNGFVGVDVFFVLSGFLVTNILLAELARTGTVRLRRFYARRMRRLLPASAVLIVATAFIWSGLVPVTERSSVATDARWAALYGANWRFVGSATDYFAESLSPSPFLHFWSLAIEEQFYVVFPLLMIGLWKLSSRRGASLLPIGLSAILLLSLAAQIYWDRENEVRAYYGTDARLYQLMAGAVLAVVIARWRPQLSGAQAGALALVGFALVLVISTPLTDMSLSSTGMLATVASMALIVGLELGPRSPVACALSRPLIVHFGQISYGTYLWHWPVTLVIKRFLELPPWVLAIVVVVLSTALAELSANMLESRLRRNVHLDPRPRSVIVGGLAISVLVATAATWILSTDAPSRVVRDQNSAPVVLQGADDLGASPRGVDWDVVAGTADGVLPPNRLCWPGDLETCVVVEGSGTRLLLIGDSHARMMLPVLTRYAEERDMTFLASTDNGCGWIEGLREWEAEGSNVDRCNGQRDNWTTELTAALDVDVVILVQRSPRQEVFESGRIELVDPEENALGYPDGVIAASDRTVRELVDAGVRVVIVEPTPLSPVDPIACLADRPKVSDCVWQEAPEPTAIEQAIRSIDSISAEVTSVSLDDVACPRLPLCVPYLDGEFAYRDNNHVQPNWWMDNLDEVGRRLDAVIG